MSWIEKTYVTGLILAALPVMGCAGKDPVVGRDDSSVAEPSDGTPRLRELGEVCFDEANDALSSSVDEVSVDDRSLVCGSGVCVANHFQGLVGCPYGQAAGAGECFRPGSDQVVPGAVEPQLVERQAAVASICSCQCDGPGPGPYCTCPESMQCEHLLDDLGLCSAGLAGSYCIPKGSAYDSNASQTACVEPHCGAAHSY